MEIYDDDSGAVGSLKVSRRDARAFLPCLRPGVPPLRIYAILREARKKPSRQPPAERISPRSGRVSFLSDIVSDTRLKRTRRLLAMDGSLRFIVRDLMAANAPS